MYVLSCCTVLCAKLYWVCPHLELFPVPAAVRRGSDGRAGRGIARLHPGARHDRSGLQQCRQHRPPARRRHVEVVPPQPGLRGDDRQPRRTGGRQLTSRHPAVFEPQPAELWRLRGIRPVGTGAGAGRRPRGSPRRRRVEPAHP